MRQSPIRTLSALLLASALLSACSNPETQKLEHLKKGDQYAKEKKDEFAVIEYASAVELDPTFGEAHLKLAETFERMDNLRSAHPEYIRAADALPDNRQLQIKATRILLMNGRFDDAKARAESLLKKNPKDIDAMLLRANAMASLRDTDGAIADIEEALKLDPSSGAALVSMGAVRLRSGDAKQAEAAFRQAIAAAPGDPEARLALASFFMAAGRTVEAEATLKEVLDKEPKHLLANRLLGTLYVGSNRVAAAEQPLKVVAESSNAPRARFQLADYYINAGRTNDAVALLSALAKEPASAAEAELKWAALDYSQKRTAEAHTRLDALLTRAPNYSDALVLKSQWLAIENKLDEALARAKAAVAAEPQSAQAHFALAVTQERRRERADATKSYQEVLRLNPRAVAAQVALSRLNLQAGDEASAQRFAEEAKQSEPGNLTARVALARSLIASGNSSRAQTEIAALLKEAPDVAVVHAVNGMHQARVNNPKGARTEYERALELSPGLFDAVSGLTYLDLAAKDTASALKRVEAALVQQPANPNLLVLLARVYNVAGDKANQEQALRKAVAADPGFMTGYTMLALLYLEQRRIDQARAEFAGIAQRDPSNVPARTMLGILLAQQGKEDEAIKVYEATANGTANAPVAANNLAFIYAQRGINLDVALQLATSAKQRLPNDPIVDDTIGWIYYKKDLPSLAVQPLESALKQLPNNAELLVHLGLTYAKLGDKEKARQALERALKLDPRVVGAEEAKRALASVSR
jgi:tetratricopeptide (TPR) repeat protein